MKQVKISVIVPVYNVENYLEKCISSLVNQTLEEIEIICINDGSEDNSPDILKRFSEQDDRVKVIDQKNQGVSAARNNGIAIAKGEYIGFVDSDDYIDEDTYKDIYEIALKRNADIAVFGGSVFSETDPVDEYLTQAQRFFEYNLTTNSAIYKNDSVRALCYERGSWPLIWNKIYKRDLVLKCGGFSHKLALGEDEAFLFSVFPLAQCVVYTEKKYYHYLRNRIGSATDKIVTNFEKRAESNLLMAKLVKEDWESKNILDKYESEYLDRYMDLLFSCVLDTSFNPEFQADYRERVVDFFNQNFSLFSKRMVDNFYILRDKSNELNRVRDELNNKKNEMYSLYHERDVNNAKIQSYEKVLDAGRLFANILEAENGKQKHGRGAIEKTKAKKQKTKDVKSVKKKNKPHNIFESKLVRKCLGCKSFYNNIVNITYLIYSEGLVVYERLKKQFGGDCIFISCAALGIGDAYLTCGFIEQWRKQNNIRNFVLLFCGKSERKMAEGLFPNLKGHIATITVKEHEWLRNLDVICEGKTDFNFIHHYNYMQPQLQLTEKIQGFKNINMRDLYLWKMGLPLTTALSVPDAAKKISAGELNKIFSKNSLQPGKTIMIAPYSTCLGSLPNSFWAPIVKNLKNRGYTLCCNCAGNQAPLEGTKPLLLEFETLVPFLEAAGGFIGFRSGLCDVISSAACKKLIIHSSKSDKWNDNNALAYVGIKNMGLCDDVVEVVVDEDDEAEPVIQNVMREINTLFKGFRSESKNNSGSSNKYKRANRQL